jgi:hypothetical protein
MKKHKLQFDKGCSELVERRWAKLQWLQDEIIWDHQCGFRCNRSTTDQIFCICQILEKKWEYNETRQLVIDFKKAFDSVRREVLYNILIVWNPHKIRPAD